MKSNLNNFQSPTPLLLAKQPSLDDILNDSQGSMEEKVAACAFFKPDFKGRIEMIIGPMFAGKSTEMLRRMKRHEISGKSCLYVKYAADTRYDVTCIATHDL